MKLVLLDANNVVQNPGLHFEDGWNFVKEENDKKVSMYDLRDTDGNYAPSPDKDGMIALRKKKQDIEMQIQKCSDDASVNNLLKNLDKQYNP